MKAVTFKNYGPPKVLQVNEIKKPVPQANEVLIKIHATTATTGDCRIRSLSLPRGLGPLGRIMFGIWGPRQPILGTEYSGIVESIGKDVTQFKSGDRVFAASGLRMGGYAQYSCTAENSAIAMIPENVNFEEAAALSFGGITALQYLRDRAKIKIGDRILIVGASGAVGTAAVQLAKHFGAEVTGVCGPTNLELVKSLGADRVKDYTKTDFSTESIFYDIILDTTGTISFAKCKGSLAKQGRLLLIAAGLPEMLQSLWVALTQSQRIIVGPATEASTDLQFLAHLVKSGDLRVVIDKIYDFNQVPMAHEYVETGRKKGNVVIRVP